MSNDLIKRSDAIKAVSKVDDYGDGIGFEVRSHCLVELELVPSANRPQGEQTMSNDLIRRSDAIGACAYETIECYEARKAIRALPSADRPQEWISCSERLPKRQGHYICTCKDGSKYKRTTVVKWSNGWQLTGARSYWIVLAWMPLPEPWKGADDDNA